MFQMPALLTIARYVVLTNYNRVSGGWDVAIRRWIAQGVQQNGQTEDTVCDSVNAVLGLADNRVADLNKQTRHKMREAGWLESQGAGTRGQRLATRPSNLPKAKVGR